MFAPADYCKLALIGLGANLPSESGSPLDTLERAVSELSAFSDEAALVSSYWQSEPIDCPPGSPVYVNAVMALIPFPEETPMTLLQRLQEIENHFGRTRSGVTNEARVLDLDLLGFRNETMAGDELVLPHPRAHKRLFVLLPLKEILPGYCFPGIEADLDELVSALDDQMLFKVV